MVKHIIVMILRNPLFIWARNLLNALRVEFKNRKNHLYIGYNSSVTNGNFGQYNTIYDNSVIDNSTLGSFTYVANNTSISNAYIGKFCSIAANCIIGMGSHPSRDFVSTHPIFFSPHKQVQISFADKRYYDDMSHSITIGNDVWIGSNVLIPNSVSIGDGAIIASGSIVTKDVPSYAIVGGVPAKIIRYRFSPEQIEFLLTFKWWDKDAEWLKANFKKFHHIDNLMS